MLKKIITVWLLALTIWSCATVPVTGRRQLDLVSQDEIIQQSSLQYKGVLDSSKLSNNQEQVAMVKRVGARIQGAVENYMSQKGLSKELAGFKWEFNLIQDDKTVNAWCMPGGKVAFYTGIMPICKDETGVAIVMGHEVAHAIANHGRERMSEAMIANGLLSGLSAAAGQNPTLTQQLLLQSIGIGTNLGMLKFSRQDESEADHIGLIFMAMAGYDPEAAVPFWQRMQANSQGAPPEFLSDHPADATRIRDIQKWLPEAKSYQKK